MDLTNSGLEKTSAENWEKAHSQEWFQEEWWEGKSLKKTFACKKTPQDHTKEAYRYSRQEDQGGRNRTRPWRWWWNCGWPREGRVPRGLLLSVFSPKERGRTECRERMSIAKWQWQPMSFEETHRCSKWVQISGISGFCCKVLRRLADGILPSFLVVIRRILEQGRHVGEKWWWAHLFVFRNGDYRKVSVLSV